MLEQIEQSLAKVSADAVRLIQCGYCIGFGSSFGALMKRGAAMVSSLMWCSGCIEQVEFPLAPDLSDLVSAYAQPTANLDEATVLEMAQQAQSVISSGKVVGDLAFFTSNLDDINDVASGVFPDGREEDILKGHLTIRALVDVEIPCPGWTDDEASDEAGTLTTKIPFNEDGMGRAFAGDLNNCRVPSSVSGTYQYLHGSLAVHLGPDVDVTDPSTLDVIVRFEGDYDLLTDPSGVPDPVDATWDFHAQGDGTLETRLSLSTGDMIIFQQDADSVGIRANNGTFLCDLQAKQCLKNDSSEEFSW